MVIYFIRHGETDNNKKGLIQGNSDTVLNENGFHQAESAEKYFRQKGIHFDQIYSSPLRRALKTASIVGNVPEEAIRKDARLEEMCFGVMEGLKYTAINNLFYDPEHYETPEGAESIDELCGRTESFLEDLAKTCGDKDDSFVVLAATHGATLRAIMQNLDPLPRKDFWRGDLENLACVKATCEKGVYHMESVIHILDEMKKTNA